MAFFWVISIQAQHFVRNSIDEKFHLQNLTMADFDNDGSNDVLGLFIFLSDIPSELSWLKNKDDGNMNFDGKIINDKSNALGEPTSGDFDNDGDIDVVVSIDKDKEDLYLLTNDGSGTFVMSSINVAGAKNLKSIDMDNDGDIDIVGIGINNDLKVYDNNGNGGFTLIKTIPSSETIGDFALADLNNDDKIDIVVVEYEFSSAKVIIYENQGSNNYSPLIILEDGKEIGSVKVTDLDMDGNNDILFTQKRKFICLKNISNFNFEKIILAEQDLFNGGQYTTFDIGDIDNDGDIDAIASTWSNNAIYWYKNLNQDKIEKFEEIEISDINTNEILIGEFSGDDKLDFFVPVEGNLYTFQNEISTEIKELNIDSRNIYPNPSSGNINIEYLGINFDQISLYSNEGNFVKNIQVDRNSIDLTTMIPGVYYLNFISGNEIITKKIVIE